MKQFLQSMQCATNVYRTGQYIVVQMFGVQLDEVSGNAAISRDTYYRRTPERDAIYLHLFAGRERTEGRRLHTSMYVRTYIH